MFKKGKQRMSRPPHSEETKAKMRAAAKEVWRQRKAEADGQ